MFIGSRSNLIFYENISCRRPGIYRISIMSLSCPKDLLTLSLGVLKDAISPEPAVPSCMIRAWPRVRSRRSVTFWTAFPRTFARLALFSALALWRLSSGLLWAVGHVVSNLSAMIARD